MKKADVTELFERLAARDAAPETELDFLNPYTLLVAVVLSAQATDVGVNKATGPLFAIADSPEKMIALGEPRVRDMIKTIGLYRNKAKNVIALSGLLIARHGSQVPRDREALEALPGVGRKTANVVLNAWPSASRPSPSTPMSFGSATAPAWRLGKTPHGGRDKGLRKIGARALQAARPPLAHLARPLCL